MEIEDKPASQLSHAATNYIDLHRHAAVRAALIGKNDIVLRLVTAHLIAGSQLWSVTPEKCKADKPATEDSVEASVSWRAFEAERTSVLEDLPVGEEGCIVAQGWRAPSVELIFARLMIEVLRLLIAGKLNSKLQAGDIVSISVQLDVKDGATTHRMPIDFSEPVRVLINELTEQGLLVFIAAGNGSLNLDEFSFFQHGVEVTYNELTANSKAIKVGYTDTDRTSTLRSNHGSNVPLYVPAESVLAACYSFNEHDRVGDLLDSVSGGFRRTSAATPMAAAVTACLQGNRLSNGKKPFTRDELLAFVAQHSDAVAGTRGHFPHLGILAAALEAS